MLRRFGLRLLVSSYDPTPNDGRRMKPTNAESILPGMFRVVTANDPRRNAEIDAAIRETVDGVDFGAVLRAEGTTTVSLDDDDHLVRIHPDGTVTRLD